VHTATTLRVGVAIINGAIVPVIAGYDRSRAGAIQAPVVFCAEVSIIAKNAIEVLICTPNPFDARISGARVRVVAVQRYKPTLAFPVFAVVIQKARVLVVA
jgi:hypothetical protein